MHRSIGRLGTVPGDIAEVSGGNHQLPKAWAGDRVPGDPGNGKSAGTFSRILRASPPGTALSSPYSGGSTLTRFAPCRA
jgi:hypothetical protein